MRPSILTLWSLRYSYVRNKNKSYKQNERWEFIRQMCCGEKGYLYDELWTLCGGQLSTSGRWSGNARLCVKFCVLVKPFVYVPPLWHYPVGPACPWWLHLSDWANLLSGHGLVVTQKPQHANSKWSTQKSYISPITPVISMILRSKKKYDRRVCQSGCMYSCPIDTLLDPWYMLSLLNQESFKASIADSAQE